MCGATTASAARRAGRMVKGRWRPLAAAANGTTEDFKPTKIVFRLREERVKLASTDDENDFRIL
jgi:hypothetical protein